MVGGRKPGGVEEGTTPVCHRTRPFSPGGIFLNGVEGEVGGAPLLGGQEATGTQVEPTRREGGTGKETSLDRQV